MTDDLAQLRAAIAGRYTILREVGAGGMARVYEATDIRHRRKVAIKVMRPELTEALGAERFQREIETSANLRHPHILPLFESGEAGESLFLEAASEQCSGSIYGIKGSFLFAPLRSHPRFIALLERMHLA